MQLTMLALTGFWSWPGASGASTKLSVCCSTSMRNSKRDADVPSGNRDADKPSGNASTDELCVSTNRCFLPGTGRLTQVVQRRY